MRLTLLFALLVSLILGCAEDGQRRDRRDRRRNRDDDAPIVKPNDNSLAAAQFAQAKARADGLRELAAQYRNGTIKSMYDAKDVYVKLDHVARLAFDEVFNSRMKREFNARMDDKSNLPSDADKVFESMAAELDKARK